MFTSLSDCLISYAPAAGLMLAALMLEQQRHAPNGTRPQHNIVLRTLIGGILGAGMWLGLLFIAHTLGSANTPMWCCITPWAFALGEGIALATRNATADADRIDI